MIGAAARAELEKQQAGSGRVCVHYRVHVRYEGSDSALAVPFGDLIEATGKVESGEQCDDGNTTAGDGGSATCQKETTATEVVRVDDSPTLRPARDVTPAADPSDTTGAAVPEPAPAAAAVVSPM